VRNPFRKDAGAPAEVVARAGLGRGERVLASTVARDGSWLLGTRSALVVVPAAGPAQTIAWQQVESADWDRDAERLRVVEVGAYGEVRPVHVFGVEEPGLLLPMVRERVTASVVLQRRVVVSGKRGLMVIARRPPAGDGETTWAYEFDAGVDPSDPAVMAAAEAGLRAAEEELGFDPGSI
jgi:hypothetical protein